MGLVNGAVMPEVGPLSLPSFLSLFLKDLTDKPKEVYETIEKPLQYVLADMESKGITLDSALLRAQASTLAKQLEHLENSVRDIAENPLMNLNFSRSSSRTSL